MVNLINSYSQTCCDNSVLSWLIIWLKDHIYFQLFLWLIQLSLSCHVCFYACRTAQDSSTHETTPLGCLSRLSCINLKCFWPHALPTYSLMQWFVYICVYLLELLSTDNTFSRPMPFICQTSLVNFYFWLFYWRQIHWSLCLVTCVYVGSMRVNVHMFMQLCFWSRI